MESSEIVGMTSHIMFHMLAMEGRPGAAGDHNPTRDGVGDAASPEEAPCGDGGGRPGLVFGLEIRASEVEEARPTSDK